MEKRTVRTGARLPIAGGEPVTAGHCPPDQGSNASELVCIMVDKVYDACSQRHCFTVEFCFAGECEPVRCEVVPNSFEALCSLTQFEEDPPLVTATVDFRFRVRVECNGQVQERLIRASMVDPRTFPKRVVLFGSAEELRCEVEAVVRCLGCDVVSQPNNGGNGEGEFPDGEWGNGEGEFPDGECGNGEGEFPDGEWGNGEGEFPDGECGDGEWVDRDTLVRCDFGVFLEIKTVALVQLLIPAFGFCPVPPECQELATRCEEFLSGPPPRRFFPQPFELID